jgi:hypothetical protein
VTPAQQIPAQCPGMTRSAASAGRCEIETASVI